MGRRAKKAPVVTKKRPKLAKLFKCPFCANDETVECRMDHKAGIGSLSCRLCGAAYQMPIHHLHEPIDVFSEWLDDCEAAQNPNRQQAHEDGDNVARYQDEEDDGDDLIETTGLGQPKNGKSSSETNKKGTAAASSHNNDRESFDDIGLGDDDDDEDDE